MATRESWIDTSCAPTAQGNCSASYCESFLIANKNDCYPECALFNGVETLVGGLRRRLGFLDDDFLVLLLDRPHAPSPVHEVVVRTKVIRREDLGQQLVYTRRLGLFEQLHGRQNLLRIPLDGEALVRERGEH